MIGLRRGRVAPGVQAAPEDRARSRKNDIRSPCPCMIMVEATSLGVHEHGPRPAGCPLAAHPHAVRRGDGPHWFIRIAEPRCGTSSGRGQYVLRSTGRDEPTREGNIDGHWPLILIGY